jgi:hypothetical protein
MAELFHFPNPVNETSARFVAAGVVLLSALALVTQWRPLLLLLAYGFVARTLTGPTLSPLGQLVTRVVTPRLHVQLRYAPGPAKRCAQAIGAVVTVTAAVLAYTVGMGVAVDALLVLMIVFALLESALGVCVGCKVFAVLIRLRIVPARICVECAEIWARNSI